MNSSQGNAIEKLPWQRAVYTRGGARDVFTFSHVEFTALEKHLPRSLSVRDLVSQTSTRATNFEALQQATVLVLVTGNWAQHVSLDTFAQEGHCHRAQKITMYDHLERLSVACGSSKHWSELSRDYKALQYHSTLSHYAQGGDHSWQLSSVVPVLSDMVILPRLLDPSRVKIILASFARATRKCMRDSLIMAGTAKYRESTLARVQDCRQASESVHQQAPLPIDAAAHH